MEFSGGSLFVFLSPVVIKRFHFKEYFIYFRGAARAWPLMYEYEYGYRCGLFSLPILITDSFSLPPFFLSFSCLGRLMEGRVKRGWYVSCRHTDMHRHGNATGMVLNHSF